MTGHAHEVKRELRGILIFIIVIWAVFLADQLLPLERLGLVPRTLHGMPGIAASPFLHTGLSHLVSNTVPLLVLLMLLAGSRSDSATVVVSIVLLGGGLLWLFGRHARHDKDKRQDKRRTNGVGPSYQPVLPEFKSIK